MPDLHKPVTNTKPANHHPNIGVTYKTTLQPNPKRTTEQWKPNQNNFNNHEPKNKTRQQTNFVDYTYTELYFVN
jgi:hypothetical protein